MNPVSYFLKSITGRTPTGIIAIATMKEAIRQPVFFLLLILVMVVILVLTFVPYFTLGEDVKVLKDDGMALIQLAGLLLAIWTSSTTIADEIEGKTAITLLSKPINRRQFVLGKYFGILMAVVLFIMPIVLWFLWWLYYKVFYDGKESSATDITSAMAIASAVQVLPGIALIFMEIAVMAALSVAISTRLPMQVNMVTCLAIFVIGHLTPNLVHAGVFKLELVQFMARLIATVLPALEVFNIQPAIATGQEVPLIYLVWAAVYSVAYSAIGILLAFIMFEDRDLA